MYIYNIKIEIIDCRVGNLYEKKLMTAGRNEVTGGNHLTFIFT